MKKNRLFLDVHVIQNLPPSNANRDDTGSPKTAQYGGVQRARVSSQAWKKAMRDYFKDFGELDNVGVRTLEVIPYVARKIQMLDENIEWEEALKQSEKVLKAVGLKFKGQKATALFFLGDRQAEGLAQAAIDGVEDKKELKVILQDNPAVDIALFGRMLADDPSLNEDASSQVAHAISTHAVQTEFDYYTAVDDESTEEHAGAGMLGTIEFNSSTLYRYANVAIHELTEQLSSNEEVIKAINLYLKAFINSLPNGKINSFANQTIPQAILVSVRDDRPVNLVSAFEKPIVSDTGYTEKSVKRMLSELDKSEKLLNPAVLNLFLDMEDTHINNISVKLVDNISELLHELNPVIESFLE